MNIILLFLILICFASKITSEGRWGNNMQEVVRTMSSLQKDFVASSLRSQVAALHDVLETIEDSDQCGDVCVTESIKRVEKELRRVRRFC